jgi:NADPH:quinone reductase-like Zn-dependent oxidoreductase
VAPEYVRFSWFTSHVSESRDSALGTLLATGDVKVVIDDTYPLERAAQAVAHMLGHHTRGKVAITV